MKESPDPGVGAVGLLELLGLGFRVVGKLPFQGYRERSDSGRCRAESAALHKPTLTGGLRRFLILRTARRRYLYDKMPAWGLIGSRRLGGRRVSLCGLGGAWRGSYFMR